MKIVYLSLGSNLGGRRETLQAAVDALHRPDFRVTRISGLYESAALEYLQQPDFLNCVVEAETSLLPMRLLARVRGVERALGRKRGIPKGPRNIDIDILLHGRAVVQSAQLQIPHPRMEGRRFVLEPLKELAPDLRHPVLRLTVHEMLSSAPHQRIVRLPLGLVLPGGGGGQE